MATMFNIYQSLGDPAIMCALPDGATAPGFLREQYWAFHGKVDDIEAEQFQCDREFVDVIVKNNGFYVYARM